MTTLMEAMNETARTDNGAVTNRSTLNACLDLFAIIGASRGKDISVTFGRAFAEDPATALRILMWARDARGGSGERQTVHTLIDQMVSLDPTCAARVVEKLPVVGYWKDVVRYVGHENSHLAETATQTLITAIGKGDGLACKWTPRKGPVFEAVRKALALTPKELRRALVDNTKVVEQQMSAQKWSTINYSHVPSVASSNYSGAFKRHDATRYGEFVMKATAGEVKVNSGVLFPHTIIQKAVGGNPIAQAQWNQLPNYFDGNGESILAVVDMSGSMSGLPMDVAMSLGIYCGQRIGGPFKNQWITFSGEPVMETLSGNTLVEIVANMHKAHVGYNTDFSKVFDLILTKAKKYGLKDADLPTKILAISDMQFDACGDRTNFQNVQQLYAAAGYKMPQLVFWNVNASEGNAPVTISDKGVALVSGFSPAIMKSIFGDISPLGVMNRAISDPRYAVL